MKYYWLLEIIGILSLMLEKASPCGDLQEDQLFTSLHRMRRQLDERDSCKPGASIPITRKVSIACSRLFLRCSNNFYLLIAVPCRVDTTKRLGALRKKMKEFDVDAYFIGSKDSHLSEKTSPADQRLQWITGFTGSNGFAVVTQEKAAMWSDGRCASFENVSQLFCISKFWMIDL